MKILRRTKFGNPILRQVAQRLSDAEIRSPEIQNLIANMRYTVEQKKYGVGLAAPQIGESLAISVIDIKPTPSRPGIDSFQTVIINPEITEAYGHRTGMWEGCLSCGTGKDTLYGKALRYKKVRLRWQDEAAATHEQDLDGFISHVAQHEVDHLNGILFVDRVRNTKTYMMQDEFYKRIVKKGER